MSETNLEQHSGRTYRFAGYAEGGATPAGADDLAVYEPIATPAEGEPLPPAGEDCWPCRGRGEVPAPGRFGVLATCPACFGSGTEREESSS